MTNKPFHPMGDANPSESKRQKKKKQEKSEMIKDPKTDGNLIAREQLKSIVERVENLEEEKKAIGDDIKDVYGEAKSNGFDVKVLKEVIKLRKMDLAERQERDATLDLYMQALGMLPDFEPAEGD